MGKRILWGTLVGSLVVFVVSSIWHMASGLGEVGIQNLPNEDAVLSAMHSSVSKPGLYFFPGMTPPAGRSSEQRRADQTAYLAKFKAGPNGILIYHPDGEELNFGKLLTIQFLVGLAASFLLCWILAATIEATTYWKRISMVVAITLFAGIIFDIPYWNWYGFPTNYTLVHMAGWVVSWGIAGLAMAAIVRRPAHT
ncbi:MAG TPA: hypothetical protein VMT28_07460 [Terriglobales bacterium]|nr:hypothetical protein [Terriglobales bacterium]